jgi:hypothetical protein
MTDAGRGAIGPALPRMERGAARPTEGWMTPTGIDLDPPRCPWAGTDPLYVAYHGENRGRYKPSVLRSAASTGSISGQRPMTFSIYRSSTVARLSAMTTESVKSPIWRPTSLVRMTRTRVGPVRRRLDVMQATIRCANPVGVSFAWTTSAGRFLYVIRFESG